MREACKRQLISFTAAHHCTAAHFGGIAAPAGAQNDGLHVCLLQKTLQALLEVPRKYLHAQPTRGSAQRNT